MERRAVRKWGSRLLDVYLVGTVLTFPPALVLFVGWRDAVPGVLFLVPLVLAFVAAVLSHVANAPNWPSSWD